MFDGCCGHSDHERGEFVSEAFKKDITAIALMREFGKLTAHEAFELEMYSATLNMLAEIGGPEVMRVRLDCLFENCVDAVKAKRGRKTNRAIELIKELGVE